ncbi:MAG: peptide ABC transporter substrate-binding protein [Bdellovibrionota bacterium]
MNLLLKSSFYTLSLTALIFTTSCTKTSSDKTLKFGVKKSETLIVNLQTEPPSLDWNKSTDTTSSEVQGNIMEGLVQFDLADPELKALPALATKWESDKAVQKWTFELRTDVKWTDGVEFDAQQVVDGWERLLNPKTAAEYSYFLYNVKNAKAYNEGKIKDFSQVGIKTVGKHKIEVQLESPMSFFPSLLVHHSTYPVRKDLIEKHGDKWTEAGNMVTLGAYKLMKWEHDEAILLERNDAYFGEKAKTKYVLGRMITEQSSAINAFDAGEIDVIPELPSNDVSVLKQRPEYQKQNGLIVYYYGFNTKQKPFDNLDFRKAVAMAIDKKEITKVLGQDDVTATSWVPKGMMGHEEEMGIKFDPAKAKEHMAKAGYADATKVPKITITFNTNENHKKVAENVQAQLKRNLGINIEILNEEWKVYLSKLKSKKGYSIFRMGWVADYPDPDNFLNLLTSTSANNHTGWKNEKYDSLIAKGVSELNSDKRKEYYKEAQKLVLEEDVAAVPLYYSIRQYLINSRVSGFKLNPLDEKDYKSVMVK